jgi:hypothetical protein
MTNLLLAVLLLAGLTWAALEGRRALRRALGEAPTAVLASRPGLPARERPASREGGAAFHDLAALGGVDFAEPISVGGAGQEGVALRFGTGGARPEVLLGELARQDGLDVRWLREVAAAPGGLVRRAISKFGGAIWFPGGVAYYRTGIDAPTGGESGLRLRPTRVVLLYDRGDSTDVVELRYPDGYDLRRAVERLLPAREDVEKDGLPWEGTNRPLLVVEQPRLGRLYVYGVQGDPETWADSALRKQGWAGTAGRGDAPEWTRGGGRITLLLSDSGEGVVVLAKTDARG